MSSRCTGSFEEVTPPNDKVVECSVCQKTFIAESYTHPVYGLSWMVPEHEKNYNYDFEKNSQEAFLQWLLEQYRYCASKAREIKDVSSEDCLCYLSEADAFYEAYHFLKNGERKYNCGIGSEQDG